MISQTDRRVQANRIIDEALRGGISFMFDDEGHLMQWQTMPDIDPGSSETYRRLCVQMDRFPRDIRIELRKRLPRNGEILMGTPLLGNCETILSREAVEWAWANRDRPL